MVGLKQLEIMGVVFVDLRDIRGVVQVVFSPKLTRNYTKSLER